MCVDEWGPLELRPIGGVAWARRKRPWRQRATYRRLQGTEQFLGFYDVHDDCLEGLFSKHKRVVDIGQAFHRLLFGSCMESWPEFHSETHKRP